MSFPVMDFVLPSALSGKSNGRLPEDVLVTIPSLHGGPDIRLCRPAARTFRAMRARAERDGVQLEATSLDDSYRVYAVQLRIHTQRYTTANTGIKCHVCGGTRYCKRDAGYATVACPGTSKHGLGCAVDFRLGLAGVSAWLQANCLAFGWCYELIPEEPWHLRHYVGDRVPQAVLDYEAAFTNLSEDEMAAPYQLVREVDSSGAFVGSSYMLTPRGRVGVASTKDLAALRAGGIAEPGGPTPLSKKQMEYFPVAKDDFSP